MKKVIGTIIGVIGVVLAVIGIWMKTKESMSVSIIGGADGPTSIFLAGKVGGDMSACVIVTGIVLLAVAGFLYFKRKR